MRAISSALTLTAAASSGGFAITLQKKFIAIKLNEVWYPYCDVPAEAVDALLQAPSVGRHYNDLKSPFFCSGGQAENLHILCVLALGDEFRERIAFCGSQEKIGKCLSQGVCNDKLRWRDAGTNGSQPGPE